MIDMLVKRLKSRLPLIGVGVISAFFVIMLPKAIKFFFRGFLLLLENPLEALCFFGILTMFTFIWIWLEEKNEK